MKLHHSLCFQQADITINYFPNDLVSQVSKLELDAGDFHTFKALPPLSVLFQSSLVYLRFILRASI